MKNKLTVTVCIPAHNEAANIGLLIESILSQRGSHFKLQKILIACDGCTDNTAEIALSYKKKSRLIEVINDGKRLGKVRRLNQFYQSNKSDFLVVFDGDTVLGNKFVLNELAKAFTDKEVGLVGGCDTPLEPTNFIQKIATVWIDVWFLSRKNFNHGVTINNHKGCASALRAELAQKIHIPTKVVVGEEDFVYLTAKELGYKFKFAEKAVVNYSVPAKFKDFFIQTTRFLSTKELIANYFGDYVYDEFEIPNINKLKAFFTVLLQEPIYLPLAVLFQIFQRIFQFKFKDNYQNGFWLTITSSK